MSEKQPALNMISHGKKKQNVEKQEGDAASLAALMENRRDRETLKMLVQIVPDDYYAWHVLSESRDNTFLHISECALASNPKSYPAWHHRLLCVQATSTDEVLCREDRLTRLLISHDSRNFHAWAYRRTLGLSVIRDVFNYSCMHDLIVRGNEISAAALVATDPYFEGGHNLLRFQCENFLHMKIFNTHLSLNFPRPFKGSIVVGGQRRDLKHPVLLCWFHHTGSEIPHVYVNSKKLLAQHFAQDVSFLDDLLHINTECALLHLSKLWYTTNREPIISRLCELDKLRQGWYKSLCDCSFRILRLVEACPPAAK